MMEIIKTAFEIAHRYGVASVVIFVLLAVIGGLVYTIHVLFKKLEEAKKEHLTDIKKSQEEVGEIYENASQTNQVLYQVINMFGTKFGRSSRIDELERKTVSISNKFAPFHGLMARKQVAEAEAEALTARDRPVNAGHILTPPTQGKRFQSKPDVGDPTAARAKTPYSPPSSEAKGAGYHSFVDPSTMPTRPKSSRNNRPAVTSESVRIDADEESSDLVRLIKCCLSH